MKIFLAFLFNFFLVAANASTVFLDSGAFDTNNSGDSTVDLTGTLHANPLWADALPGSEWISYGSTGDPTDPGYFSPVDGIDVTFSTSFMVSGTITNASLAVLADDSASVILNGNMLMHADLTPGGPCAQEPIGCISSEEGILTFAMLAPYLVDGTNTLSFQVVQVAGISYGLDFAGEVTSDETPEPATLAMFSGGLLSLALLRKRGIIIW